MLYQVASESSCYKCTIPDACCEKKNIQQHYVYKSLGDGKYYAFVHDSAECGGLMEVVPQENCCKEFKEFIKKTCGLPDTIFNKCGYCGSDLTKD